MQDPFDPDLLTPEERTRERHPELLGHVIFLSGGAFTPAGQRFLAEITPRYLEKPFDVATLRYFVGPVFIVTCAMTALNYFTQKAPPETHAAPSGPTVTPGDCATCTGAPLVSTASTSAWCL